MLKALSEVYFRTKDRSRSHIVASSRFAFRSKRSTLDLLSRRGRRDPWNGENGSHSCSVAI
jgi:hypothetical protein